LRGSPDQAVRRSGNAGVRLNQAAPAGPWRQRTRHGGRALFRCTALRSVPCFEHDQSVVAPNRCNRHASQPV